MKRGRKKGTSGGDRVLQLLEGAIARIEGGGSFTEEEAQAFGDEVAAAFMEWGPEPMRRVGLEVMMQEYLRGMRN